MSDLSLHNLTFVALLTATVDQTSLFNRSVDLPAGRIVWEGAAQTPSIAQRAPSFNEILAQAPIPDRFDYLKEAWKSEIWRESSLSKITSNEHYRAIIKLGPSAVPLILQELEKTPGAWFVALRALTKGRGTETIGREFAGDFRKMAECWIKWGRENGEI